MLLVGFATTEFRQFGALLAIVIPTVINLVAHLDSAKVSELGAIPRGVPVAAPPAPELSDPNIIVSAFAIAVIVLVQGVGVGETVRTPGRQRPDVDRDFIAEGAANLVSDRSGASPSAVGQPERPQRRRGSEESMGGQFQAWLLVVVVLPRG